MMESGVIYREIEQGSSAWHEMRRGKVTASRVKDILATVKNGEAAAVRNYRAQLVCERLTGTIEESYTNGAMLRGTELEPVARECYEFVSSNTVEQVAFVDHPSIFLAGCSPDGLIGDDGLVEIKCPNTATHLDYLLAQVPPAEYVPQMQWQMACTGRMWCDFVSFDNRLPEEYQLFIVRLQRDDKYVADLEQKVITFLESVETMITRLSELR